MKTRQEINNKIDAAYRFRNDCDNIMNQIASKIPDKDKEVILHILLYGEAFVSEDESCLFLPSEYFIEFLGETKGAFLPKGNVYLQGKYYANYTSPYDIRGTSFFNPNTLELREKDMNAVINRLLKIYESPYIF